MSIWKLTPGEIEANPGRIRLPDGTVARMGDPIPSSVKSVTIIDFKRFVVECQLGNGRPLGTVKLVIEPESRMVHVSLNDDCQLSAYQVVMALNRILPPYDPARFGRDPMILAPVKVDKVGKDLLCQFPDADWLARILKKIREQHEKKGGIDFPIH